MILRDALVQKSRRRRSPLTSSRIQGFYVLYDSVWHSSETETAKLLAELDGLYALVGHSAEGGRRIKVGMTKVQAVRDRARNGMYGNCRFPYEYTVFALPNIEGVDLRDKIAQERLLMAFTSQELPGELHSDKGQKAWGHNYRRACDWLFSIAPHLSVIGAKMNPKTARQLVDRHVSPSGFSNI